MANPLDRELERRILEAKYSAGRALANRPPAEVEQAQNKWAKVLESLQTKG